MSKGYTLIETLVVLSILSIIAGASLLVAQSFIANNTQVVEVQKLLGALRYARATAIHQGKKVIFCGSSDLHHCDGQWQQGQIIKENDQILQVFPKLRAGGYWEWRSNLGRNHHIEFSELGFTNGQQGSLYYYTRENKSIYRIVLTYGGEIRVELY